MYKLPPNHRSGRQKAGWTVALAFLALLIAFPAGASKLFTVDFDGDDLNELDGSDDVPINFAGSTGTVDGFIRAVNITGVSRAALTADVQFYQDFLGNYPGGADFTVTDTLIFDVVLNPGSAPIDEIGVAVGSDPLFLDPDGAGYLDPCDPGLPLGCRSNVPGGGIAPDDVSLSPGFAPFFPGAALFSFGKVSNNSADNLMAGQISVRMFVMWTDTGPGSPLSRIDQTAVFMVSSGVNQDFFTDIVPEPTTGLLVGFGLAGLSLARKRRTR